MIDSKNKLSFRILPEDIEVQASQKQTILDALLSAHIDINHSCGGMGSCGTCRVYVVKGLELLGPSNEVEKEIAEDRKFSVEERLSCQNFVRNGLVLKKPN